MVSYFSATSNSNRKKAKLAGNLIFHAAVGIAACCCYLETEVNCQEKKKDSQIRQIWSPLLPRDAAVHLGGSRYRVRPLYVINFFWALFLFWGATPVAMHVILEGPPLTKMTPIFANFRIFVKKKRVTKRRFSLVFFRKWRLEDGRCGYENRQTP